MTTALLNKNPIAKVTNSLTGSLKLSDENSEEYFFSIFTPYLKDYIKEEIDTQLSLILDTQKALISETAEISLRVDALEQENKNLATTYFENVQMKKMLANIKKILSFKKLESDWNGKGTEPISEKLINLALDFINLSNLKYQPSVFPTGRGSIQFEYQKSNGDYLEIEAFENYYTLYSEIDLIETEKENLTIQEILGEINAFHSRH